MKSENQNDWYSIDENGKEILCPDGCAKIILPFTEFSRDNLIREINWRIKNLGEENNGEILWGNIYKDIAELTANKLNLKGRYGGFAPAILDFSDNCIFWIVEKDYAHQLCEKHEVYNYDDMLLSLANENINAFEEEFKEIDEELAKELGDDYDYEDFSDEENEFSNIDQVGNDIMEIFLLNLDLNKYVKVLQKA